MPQVGLLFATDAKEQMLYEKMVEAKLLLGMGARNNKTPVLPTRTGACSEDLPVQWKGQPQRAKGSIEGTKKFCKMM